MDYNPGTKTILVVEDEDLLCQIIAETLGDLGFHVLTAANGSEGLAVAKDFFGEIHLLVTDLLMPQLDGARLAESLRQQRPHMKVLFVTGDTNEMSPLGPGMACLNKPFTLKMLATSVRELLGS